MTIITKPLKFLEKNVFANNFLINCAQKMADPILEMANETQ